MKLSLTILALIFGFSCSLVTSFDDDENNGNNENNVNNLNNPINEICDNGIDDDNNGEIDCADPYCDGHSACRCTDTTIFFTSDKTCDHNQVCLVDQNANGLSSYCGSTDLVASGEMYDRCGADGECPFGALCLFDGHHFNWECVPLCSENNPYCPNGEGVCIASFEPLEHPDDISICLQNTICDPTSTDECAPGKACVPFINNDGSVMTRCMPYGDNPRLQPCGFYADCQPGNICIGDEDPGCIPICNLGEDFNCHGIAEDWSCRDVGMAPFGICLPPEADDN